MSLQNLLITEPISNGHFYNDQNFVPDELPEMATDELRTEFNIPEPNYAEFSRNIGKLNKRAARLGLAPIVVTVLSEEFRPVKGGAIKIFVVKVEGETPKINGWQFCGSIEYVQGEKQSALLHSVRGVTIPREYRLRPAWCEHCQKERVRKNTYILQHESGEFKQVGRKCLGDFLRTTTPEAIAEAAEFLFIAAGLAADAEERDEFEDAELLSAMGSAHNELGYVETLDFLAHVALQVREHGWVSKSSGTPKNPPTIEVVTANWSARRHFAPTYKSPSEQDQQTASDAMAWAKNLDADALTRSEYLENLNVLASQEYTPRRRLAFLASLINAYQKAQDDIQRAQTTAKIASGLVGGGHIGVVGKRDTFLFKYADVKILGDSQYNRYATRKLVRLEDEHGRQAVWYTESGIDRTQIDFGEWLVCKATVKEHSEYRGVPQTVLTRVTDIQKHDAASDA